MSGLPQAGGVLAAPQAPVELQAGLSHEEHGQHQLGQAEPFDELVEDVYYRPVIIIKTLII
jgi:hypothetical protein